MSRNQNVGARLFQLSKVVLHLVDIIICVVKGDAMATGSGELASSLGGGGGGG